MKLSIIVPVYNTSKYLKKCLDSLVNQTLEEIEVIVVNDGSTDNSVDIIKSYEKKYKNKMVFLDKKNGGQGSARNLGIKYAKGEYIGFVDSDDFVDLKMYEEMYEVAKSNKSDIVICNTTDFYEKDNSEEVTSLAFNNNVNNKEAIIKCVPCILNKIYKKDLLVKSEFKFNESIWYEDLSYSIIMLMNAKKINYIEDPFYYYLHRNTSTMNNNNAQKNLNIIKAYDELVKYAKENNLYKKFKDELDYILLKEVYISTINRVIRTSNKRSEKLKIIKEIRSYYNSYSIGKTKYFKKLPKSHRMSYYLIKFKMYSLIYIIFKLKGKK